MSSNLTIVKGDYFFVGFTLKPTSGYTYVDITNYKFMIKLRPSKFSTVVMDSWDETSPLIHIDPLNGFVSLSLPALYTDAMTVFDKAVFNIWYYDPTSAVGFVSDEYSVQFVV